MTHERKGSGDRLDDGQPLQHDQHGCEQQDDIQIGQRHPNHEQQREAEEGRRCLVGRRRDPGKYDDRQPEHRHHAGCFQQCQAEQREQATANLGPRLADGDRRTEHGPPDDDGEHAAEQHTR
ncbi:Uncharacterised protein [Mycobacterium tuberculosis]|uniref:Uncharacterized protein n=1 Tax=Mycobacterium tuberculosis TaxID=1773 RepID=A0A654TUB6_MYCTX|nr:Uncharacterised protein [Mycobacterium tuberculosis]CFE83237.1 Uncharacterised protein [Mycobacterium tuberculosis]CKQ87757.1 Uncharacterised protein [Mycobacterium tuberculosis]CKR88764.1 Uncharacterised protein [Mycobacterium tuberculosis]CKT32463.1 Uncharacterised protein [Mycobacterium tuberculosis]